MPIVEVRCRPEGDEELSAVRIRAAVSHRQDPRLVVPELRRKLVSETVSGAADALAQRVAALDHEAVDDTVKNHAVIVGLISDLLVVAGIGPGLGPLRKTHKIFNGLWRLLIEQPGRECPFGGVELRI